MSNKHDEGREEKTIEQFLNYSIFGCKALGIREGELYDSSGRLATIDVLHCMKDYADQQTKSLREQLAKERETYNDLKNSVQRHFQTLIARNYNNIGVWSNERQDYNFQLIGELESLLKEHNSP